MNWAQVLNQTLNKSRNEATAELEARSKTRENEGKEGTMTTGWQNRTGESSSTRPNLGESGWQSQTGESRSTRPNPEKETVRKKQYVQQYSNMNSSYQNRPVAAENRGKYGGKEANIDPDTAWKRATNVVTSLLTGPMIPEIMEDNARHISSTFKAVGIRPILESEPQGDTRLVPNRVWDQEQENTANSAALPKPPDPQNPTSTIWTLSLASKQSVISAVLSLWSHGSRNLAQLNTLFALLSDPSGQVDRELLVKESDALLKEAKDLVSRGVITSEEDTKDLETIDSILAKELRQEHRMNEKPPASASWNPNAIDSNEEEETAATTSAVVANPTPSNENDIGKQIMEILLRRTTTAAVPNLSAKKTESQGTQHQMTSPVNQLPLGVKPSLVSDGQRNTSAIVSAIKQLVRSNPSVVSKIINDLKEETKEVPVNNEVQNQEKAPSDLFSYSSPGFPVKSENGSSGQSSANSSMSDVAGGRYLSPSFPVRHEPSTNRAFFPRPVLPTAMFPSTSLPSTAYPLSPLVIGSTSAIPPFPPQQPATLSPIYSYGASTTTRFGNALHLETKPARMIIPGQYPVEQPQIFGDRVASHPPWFPKPPVRTKRTLFPTTGQAVLENPVYEEAADPAPQDDLIYVGNNQLWDSSNGAPPWSVDTWERSRGFGQYPENDERCEEEDDGSEESVQQEEDEGLNAEWEEYLTQWSQQPKLQYPKRKRGNRGGQRMAKIWPVQKKRKTAWGNRSGGYQPVHAPPPTPNNNSMLDQNGPRLHLTANDLRRKIPAKRALPPNDLRRKLPPRQNPDDDNGNEAIGNEYQHGGLSAEEYFHGEQAFKLPVHQRLSFGRGKNRGRMGFRGGADETMTVTVRNEFGQSDIAFQDDPAY